MDSLVPRDQSVSIWKSNVFAVCILIRNKFDIYIYIYIIYYGNINKDTITLKLFPPLLLYCDPQLLCTHTLFINSNCEHWGATCSQLRLALYHTDPSWPTPVQPLQSSCLFCLLGAHCVCVCLCVCVEYNTRKQVWASGTGMRWVSLSG